MFITVSVMILNEIYYNDYPKVCSATKFNRQAN